MSMRILPTLLFALLLLAAVAPLAADTRIERELALGPGGRFVLDTDDGSVEVVGTSRPNARVVITSRRDDVESLYDMRFEEQAGEVRIEVDRKGKRWSWFGGSRGGGLAFEIEVPQDVELEIDTAGGSISVESVGGPARLDTSGGAIHARGIGAALIADTSGGSISVEDVDGDVDADTSGGSIEIAGVRGKVRADTSGGGIRIREVDGDVEADTSGGGIRVEDAGGRVQADTSGGPITVSFAPANARGGELFTSGGGVEVRLDPAVSLEIDASSSGGSVVSDLPITVQGKVSRTSLRGQLGGGGELLKLRSSGGGIRIRAR